MPKRHGRPSKPMTRSLALFERLMILRHRGLELGVLHRAHVDSSRVKLDSKLRHPNLVGYLDWFAGANGLDREVYLAGASERT